MRIDFRLGRSGSALFDNAETKCLVYEYAMPAIIKNVKTVAGTTHAVFFTNSVITNGDLFMVLELCAPVR